MAKKTPFRRKSTYGGGWIQVGSPRLYGVGSSYTPPTGDIRYVDQVLGNDGWDGTTQTYVGGTTGPWKTVSKVNGTTHPAGRSVLFKRGCTWREFLNPGSGRAVGTSWSAPVTFGAYGTGAMPLLLGSLDYSSTGKWSVYSGNIYRATISELVGTTQAVGLVMFNDGALTGYRRASAVACTLQGDYYWDNTNKYVYLYSVGNPGSFYSGIEITRGGVSDGQYNRMQTANVYMTWDGLEIRNSGMHGIMVYGGYKKILNCLFSWCGGIADGTYRDYNGIFTWTNTSGNSVDVEIAYNVFHDCWEKSISLQTQMSGLQFSKYRVHHNLMYDTCGGGLEIWLGPTSGYTQATDIWWAHNVVYNGGGSVLYPQRNDGAHQFESLRSSFYVGSTITNSKCINNIVHTSRPKFNMIRNADSKNGWTWDYNCYYPGNESDDFHYNGVDTTWANYRSQTGFDSHGFLGDPLFLDKAGHDFHLASASSPCVDAGVVCAEVGQTVLGSAPDIGAYEYA